MAKIAQAAPGKTRRNAPTSVIIADEQVFHLKVKCNFSYRWGRRQGRGAILNISVEANDLLIYIAAAGYVPGVRLFLKH